MSTIRQVPLASFANARGSAPMMSAVHLPLMTEYEIELFNRDELVLEKEVAI